MKPELKSQINSKTYQPKNLRTQKLKNLRTQKLTNLPTQKLKISKSQKSKRLHRILNDLDIDGCLIMANIFYTCIINAAIAISKSNIYDTII